MTSAKKILSDLIPDYYDQLLPFYVNGQHVKEYCKLKSFENSDLTNLKIAVAGYGAIIEVANLVMGAKDQRKGTQHAEMSFSSVIERLEMQETDIDHLRSAYGFLEQAENYLRYFSARYLDIYLEHITEVSIIFWNSKRPWEK